MLWIFIVCGSLVLQTGSCFQESSLAFVARDGKGWSGWGSETSSKFFDIALTALAFLSFGVFLLNLLLNALLFPTSASSLTPGTAGPILTMLPGTTGGIIGTRRSSRSRVRREAFSPEVDLLTSMESVVYFVTRSIDTMVKKHECLPNVLCEGNRKSRVMDKFFQIIIPVISITLSYVGKSLGLYDQLEHNRQLEAILLGTSEANCAKIFSNVNCK